MKAMVPSSDIGIASSTFNVLETEPKMHDEAQRRAAEASRDAYQKSLTAAGYGTISTEILAAGPFFYAEDYHQQYLAKNPDGYCGIGGTGVSCPTGLGA
jgi:peptide-methionine (S)-S-oxide reductase